MRRSTTWITMAIIAACGAMYWASSSFTARASDHRGALDRGVARFRYEVLLTNLTRQQIFSPAVVYTHNEHMQPLFELGQPAREEVAGVAEDAILDPLLEQVSASPNVRDAVVLMGAEGPILPGETGRMVVEASARESRLSVVGMLVTTNDAMYALNGESGPLFGSREFHLSAYDAGSEANTELCEHIPGPPCGNAGVRVTEGAEGYVHIHAGIHGVGDLTAADFDWRNPVALLKVRRLGRHE